MQENRILFYKVFDWSFFEKKSFFQEKNDLNIDLEFDLKDHDLILILKIIKIGDLTHLWLQLL